MSSAQLVLLLWVPAGLGLCFVLPIRRAVITGYIVGWMFLPQAGIQFAGLPDYSRMTAVNLVMLLGIALTNPHLLRFRKRAFDLPIVGLCLCPLTSSLSNGLGFHDAIAGVLTYFLTYGAPYWIGRGLFRTWASTRQLAVGIFVGGLLYVPICIWEARMGPTLHNTVYGFSSTTFMTTRRLGGYRPLGFLQNGLAVGVWMCATALIGLWLWRSRSLVRLRGMSSSWWAVGLFATAVLCRSLGALALLMAILGALYLARRTRRRWILAAVILAPILYVTVRVPGVIYPQRIVDLAHSIDADRGASLEFRLKQEELLIARAWRRPVFGWGGFGRNRVQDTSVGKEATVTDALWIIIFGQRGLFGLVSLMLFMTLPAWMLLRRTRVVDWWSPACAPTAALGIAVILYLADGLLNAMLNPVFHLACGAVLSTATAQHALRPPTRYAPGPLPAPDAWSGGR